ncbi:MAG: helix-turn-helix domain-containing protein [Burkholderiaceae bacterium]
MNSTSISNIFSGIEIRRVGGALGLTEYALNDNRYHLFLLACGDAAVNASGRHQLRPAALCWLTGGPNRTIRQEAGSDGVLISITESVISRCITGDATGSQVLQTIQQEHFTGPVDPERFATVRNHAGLIEREMFDNSPGAQSVVQSTLSIMLVHLWRLCGDETVRPLPVPGNLVRTFLSVLDAHLHDHWSVADYARHIGITQERLTSAMERATGHKPLALIHARMLDEAQLLLMSSNQQIAQIAFTLGYNDPAYFNRFFKRMTGFTPARYRRQSMALTVESDRSFAAWP